MTPFSRLGGYLLSWWTCILIGPFSVGGWEPGTPPDWGNEAAFAFLLARQSWEGFPFQNTSYL